MKPAAALLSTLQKLVLYTNYGSSDICLVDTIVPSTRESRAQGAINFGSFNPIDEAGT
jgi:hypothetical protein